MKTGRIKIAFVLTPITFGGAEQVSLNLLRTLDRKRFDIRPILLTRPWDPETYFAEQLRQIGLPYVTIPVALKKGGDPLRVHRVFRRLYKLFKCGNFQLVHTQGYFADICGLPAARLLSIPSLTTCHGFIANDRNLRFYNFLDKMVLRLSCKVIVVSHSIGEMLIHSGLRTEQIVLLSNAVETDFKPQEVICWRRDTRESLQITKDELVVGYLGRLSEEKGLRYLIEAIALLQKENQEIRLLLVGKGPQQEELVRLSKTMKIEKKVIFAGFQTDTAKWLAAMDIFALPSLTEGSPMALLEAMAIGLPVVASAVGGVPIIIKNKENGILVLPMDTPALLDALRHLLENTVIIDSLGKAAKHTIESKYSLNTWSRSIGNIYQQVLV
jgi:glycosyltransferase involved in cell wall biosynthesis